MTLDLWFTEKHEDKTGLTFKVKDILYSNKSEFQKIDVIDTEQYGRMLLLDELVMTTEKDEFFYHELITHIPMLSHPGPEKVLVIGGGDGGTVREVLRYPSVREVVLCEIDRMVIDVSKEYFPSIACKIDDPKVTVNIEDAVKYIERTKGEFDVILIDSTDPLGPGVGLFTEEFYNNVKKALKPDGIMTAQSESPIVCQKEFKLINNLLNKVFPIVKPYLGPVPTYPGSYWSWTFCSESVDPASNINLSLVESIEKGCKYYNREIHSSAFALPNYVKELTSDKEKV